MIVLKECNNNEEYKWKEIVEVVSVTFNMNAEEIVRFKKNKIAKLIGALPFLAGCNEPSRTSLSNLATYIIAAKGGKKIFNHSPNDDLEIMNRLKTISSFDGGNKDIITKGLNLLCLNMVHGYKKDCEKDITNNKYNPVTTQKWNYLRTVKSLTEKAQSIKCSEMDEILGITETVFSYWSYT